MSDFRHRLDWCTFVSKQANDYTERRRFRYLFVRFAIVLLQSYSLLAYKRNVMVTNLNKSSHQPLLLYKVPCFLVGLSNYKEY